MDEGTTRKILIDKALEATGWSPIVRHRPGAAYGTAAVETARRRVERPEQSILARAFRGKLVPQDPNDEPTSVLLGRIRADRPKSNTTKKPLASNPREKKRQNRMGMANV